jgi:hypothetical protein
VNSSGVASSAASAAGGRRGLPEAFADQQDAVGPHVLTGQPESVGEAAEGVAGPDAQHQVVVAVGHVGPGIALVQDEPVGQAARGRGGLRAFEGVRVDVDAVGVPVGVVGEGLQRPRGLAAAEVEDPGRRLPVRPAQEPVDVDTGDRGRDRVVRVGDAAEPSTVHRHSQHDRAAGPYGDAAVRSR